MAPKTPVKKYKLGDMWSTDFDFDGMLVMFRRALAGQMSVPDMEKLSASMEDVNYHTDNRQLRAKIDAMKSGAGAAGGKPNELLVQATLTNLESSINEINKGYNSIGNSMLFIDRAEAAIGVKTAKLQSAFGALDAARQQIIKATKAVNEVKAQLNK